jgi:uncharacterized small protein (TIGR04563 family)
MARKKSVTLYFPEALLDDMRGESLRQERSLSWIIETAWRMAREDVSKLPGIDELTEDAQSEIREKYLEE